MKLKKPTKKQAVEKMLASVKSASLRTEQKLTRRCKKIAKRLRANPPQCPVKGRGHARVDLPASRSEILWNTIPANHKAIIGNSDRVYGLTWKYKSRQMISPEANEAVAQVYKEIAENEAYVDLVRRVLKSPANKRWQWAHEDNLDLAARKRNVTVVIALLQARPGQMFGTKLRSRLARLAKQSPALTAAML